MVNGTAYTPNFAGTGVQVQAKPGAPFTSTVSTNFKAQVFGGCAPGRAHHERLISRRGGQIQAVADVVENVAPLKIPIVFSPVLVDMLTRQLSV